MAVMDEFQKEREALKQASLQKRFSYFWTYYKWHVVALVVVISLGASFVHSLVNKKELGFYAALINASDLEGDALLQDFLQTYDLDARTYDYILDSSLFLDANGMSDASVATTQKLVVYLAAAQLDVMVTGQDVFSQYAYTDTFTDLRTLLTPRELEQLSDRLYYIDRAVVARIAEAQERMDDSYSPEIVTDPALMEEPVPVGVILSDDSPLNKAYAFSGTGAVLGIVVNTKNGETAVNFLRYAMQDALTP